jgi:hypothetical protein
MRAPCGLGLSSGALAPKCSAPGRMCLAHVASGYSSMHLNLDTPLVMHSSRRASLTDQAPNLNPVLNDRLRVIWKRVSKLGVVILHIHSNTTYNGHGHIMWFHDEMSG